MKKHGKIPPKTTDYNTESNKTVVEEPTAGYGYQTLQDPIAMRTIGLMGMKGNRDFATIRSDSDFIKVIRAGIPKEAMIHLMDIAELTLTEMAD